MVLAASASLLESGERNLALPIHFQKGQPELQVWMSLSGEVEEAAVLREERRVLEEEQLAPFRPSGPEELPPYRKKNPPEPEPVLLALRLPVV